jgi:hypothetical protein
LISGGQNVIDVSDLQVNAQLTGFAPEDGGYIAAFWNCVHQMSQENKEKFL